MSRLKVLIDLNIILDVLQKRQPFFAASAGVLACAEAGKIEGLVAAHTLTTLFYLVARSHSADHARIALIDLLRFLTVAAVDQTAIEDALKLPYRDFEDAVQMAAAVGAGAQYLVTRDLSDYKLGPLPVLQPAELLALV